VHRVLACGILFWNCSSPEKSALWRDRRGDGGGSGGTVAPLDDRPTSHPRRSVSTGVDSGSGAATGSTATPKAPVAARRSPNRAPADILIVLDLRAPCSTSIADDCYCLVELGQAAKRARTLPNCTDRWSAVKSALARPLPPIRAFNWGLEYFFRALGR